MVWYIKIWVGSLWNLSPLSWLNSLWVNKGQIWVWNPNILHPKLCTMLFYCYYSTFLPEPLDKTDLSKVSFNKGKIKVSLQNYHPPPIYCLIKLHTWEGFKKWQGTKSSGVLGYCKHCSWPLEVVVGVGPPLPMSIGVCSSWHFPHCFWPLQEGSVFGRYSFHCHVFASHHSHVPLPGHTHAHTLSMWGQQADVEIIGLYIKNWVV